MKRSIGPRAVLLLATCATTWSNPAVAQTAQVLPSPLSLGDVIQRTMIAIDDSVDAGLIARNLGEYREMSGLTLTMDQARMLWAATP